MDLKYVTDYLDQFINFEKDLKRRELGIDIMKKLCDFFDHPENTCPSIHVAGSKGKGSICTMISSIASVHGRKVGIYRSPHVRHFSERISGADGPFSEQIYRAAFNILKAGISDFKKQNSDFDLTWFEVVTLYAFLVFREAECDFAVYEVGMGGRLDATNVVIPKAVVISTIELEHVEVLGSTITEVAHEKAGIIKPGVPVVVCHQKEQAALDVFRKAAKEKQAGVVYFLQEYQPSVSYYLDDSKKLRMEIEPEKFDLGLVGDFQAMNAKAAEMACRLVYSDISDDEIHNGLRDANLPGRFDIYSPADLASYSNIPYLILDGSHTKNSIAGAVNLLRKYRELNAKQKTFDSCLTDFSMDEKPILIFGCAKDKNASALAQELKEIFSKIYLTRPGDFKKSDLSEIEKAFTGFDAEIISDPDFKNVFQDAFSEAEKTGRGIVVLGSLYLVGEVKRFLEQDIPKEWI